MKKIRWRRIYYLLRWIANWLFLIFILFTAGCLIRIVLSGKNNFSWTNWWFYMRPVLGAWVLLVVLSQVAKKKHNSFNKNF